MYTLQPGSVIQGHVLNPGTLGTVNQLNNSSYLNATSFKMPFSTSSSSTLNNLLKYLESHPLVLLITIFFGLIILLAIIRAVI
jgi:hypothetical protein